MSEIRTSAKAARSLQPASQVPHTVPPPQSDKHAPSRTAGSQIAAHRAPRLRRHHATHPPRRVPDASPLIKPPHLTTLVKLEQTRLSLTSPARHDKRLQSPRRTRGWEKKKNKAGFDDQLPWLASVHDGTCKTFLSRSQLRFMLSVRPKAISKVRSTYSFERGPSLALLIFF